MATSKVQLKIKEAGSHKPSLEDMYLIDEPVKSYSKLQEAKQFLLDIGEDPSEYSNKQLLHMLENGF